MPAASFLSYVVQEENGNWSQVTLTCQDISLTTTSFQKYWALTLSVLIETWKQMHPSGWWLLENIPEHMCIFQDKVEEMLRPRALVWHRPWWIPQRFLSHCPLPCTLSSSTVHLLLPPQTPLLLSSPLKSGLVFSTLPAEVCLLPDTHGCRGVRKRLFLRQLWIRNPGQEPFYPVLGLWCTAGAPCCFHNQEEDDKAKHSHPRSPTYSWILTKMSCKREPGNLDNYSSGMLGNYHFSFHSFSYSPCIFCWAMRMQRCIWHISWPWPFQT